MSQPVSSVQSAGTPLDYPDQMTTTSIHSTAGTHHTPDLSPQDEDSRSLSRGHYMLETHEADTPLDYQLLEYISPPDANLCCPICRNPFVDPVSVSPCEHYFCRTCLLYTWRLNSDAADPSQTLRSGSCPTCRARSLLNKKAAASRMLVNILDDMRVRCPRYEVGCLKEVRRGDVGIHYSEYCDYRFVKCLDDRPCDKPVRRRDAGTCLHSPVSCVDCRQEMEVVDLEHHWNTHEPCADRKTSCRACKAQVFYRSLSSHISDQCPVTQIPCPGAKHGCKVIRLARNEMPDHATQCIFARLAPSFQQQSDRISALTDSNTYLSRRTQILESSFHSVDRIIATSEDDTTMLTVNPSSDPYTDPEADWRNGTSDPGFSTPYTHLLSLHESLRSELSRLSSALTDLDSRHTLTLLNENMRLKEDLAYLGGQMGGLARQVGWLTSARLQREGSGLGAMGIRASSNGGGNAEARDGRNGEGGSGVGVTRTGMGRRMTDEGRTKL